MDEPIDTRRSQETPEGVELMLTPAGPLVRALAWVIDLAIRLVVYIALSAALARLGRSGVGILLVVAFLLEWGYPVIFEVLTGSTPGKQALSLAVVHHDGSPPTLGSALLRNLIRFVDFLPLAYLLGLVACLSNDRFQRLGDLAAGTLVVHRDRIVPIVLEGKERPQPPRVPLTVEEQRAIVAFAQRSACWSEERRAELASHTGSCTQGSGSERVQQLRAHARWIAGER